MPKIGCLSKMSENAPHELKAVLISVTTNQDAVFGKTEIEEIFSRMEETGSDCYNYKPEKMVRMIASRACRKSIMINDTLDHKRMRNVLNNLTKKILGSVLMGDLQFDSCSIYMRLSCKTLIHYKIKKCYKHDVMLVEYFDDANAS